MVVTRCSNNYGPLQFPEKLIPLMIINTLEDKKLPVYGDGMQVRDWIHVEDHNAGRRRGAGEGPTRGEVYNIGARNERYNIDIVKQILAHLQKPETLIEHVKDRPGHDRRYAIEPKKMQDELGWTPQKDPSTALAETIEWYVSNQTWWQRVRSGAYKDYYEKQYGDR